MFLILAQWQETVRMAMVMGDPEINGEAERIWSLCVPSAACYAHCFLFFSCCVIGYRTQLDIQSYLMDCKINYHNCQSWKNIIFRYIATQFIHQSMLLLSQRIGGKSYSRYIQSIKNSNIRLSTNEELKMLLGGKPYLQLGNKVMAHSVWCVCMYKHWSCYNTVLHGRSLIQEEHE